jgi:hypothetical protein
LKFFPGPSFGGPDSIFHEDGASTEVTGTEVLSKASITGGNGSRISPEKLKPENGKMTDYVEGKSMLTGLPKMASTT